MTRRKQFRPVFVSNPIVPKRFNLHANGVSAAAGRQPDQFHRYGESVTRRRCTHGDGVGTKQGIA